MAALEYIEGVGKTQANKLRKAGIGSTTALLKAGGKRKGRADLAAATGLTEHQILEWVNRVDLMRVKGIGSEYSDLLEQAGVDSVPELKKRKPASLHAKLLEVNGARKRPLVRRPPSLSEVERWVANAKALDRAVSY